MPLRRPAADLPRRQQPLLHRLSDPEWTSATPSAGRRRPWPESGRASRASERSVHDDPSRRRRSRRVSACPCLRPPRVRATRRRRASTGGNWSPCRSVRAPGHWRRHTGSPWSGVLHVDPARGHRGRALQTRLKTAASGRLVPRWLSPSSYRPEHTLSLTPPYVDDQSYRTPAGRRTAGPRPPRIGRIEHTYRPRPAGWPAESPTGAAARRAGRRRTLPIGRGRRFAARPPAGCRWPRQCRGSSAEPGEVHAVEQVPDDGPEEERVSEELNGWVRLVREPAPAEKRREAVEVHEP